MIAEVDFGWIEFRDIVEVDGRTVRDHDNRLCFRYRTWPFPNADEFAKQTQNPVSSLISVPFQGNWDVGQANFLFPRRAEPHRAGRSVTAMPVSFDRSGSGDFAPPWLSPSSNVSRLAYA